MTKDQMRALIDEHIAAEVNGDPHGAVRMYTDDVEHDVVGWPTGPVHGPEAAEAFYSHLITLLADQEMTITRERYGDSFCVVEHDCAATVNGEFMGIPAQGRRVAFRMLHVWEFKDGAMSRENVWLDGGAIAAQLTAP
jgi:ketosteroid isomerase-like protein